LQATEIGLLAPENHSLPPYPFNNELQKVAGEKNNKRSRGGSKARWESASVVESSYKRQGKKMAVAKNHGWWEGIVSFKPKGTLNMELWETAFLRATAERKTTKDVL
jgi:hypothetical protein